MLTEGIFGNFSLSGDDERALVESRICACRRLDPFVIQRFIETSSARMIHR